MQLVSSIQNRLAGSILCLQSTAVSPVQLILQKHLDVFQEGLGTLTGFKVKIIIDLTLLLHLSIVKHIQFLTFLVTKLRQSRTT